MNWNIAGIVHIIETTAQEEVYLVDGIVIKHGLMTDYTEESIIIELTDGITHIVHDDEISEYYIEGNMLIIELK